MGPGRDESRLSEQVVKLKRELGGIVSLPVEREGFGKHRHEAFSVVVLEADLPGVKREREAKRDIQPLDAELEPLEPTPATLANTRSRRTQRTLSLGFSPDS
jgi:hypothetical protein